MSTELESTPSSGRPAAYLGKRALDLVLASAALVLLSPVILFLTVWIRVSMGSPVLFRQERPGFGGRPFCILKFRTMTDARDDSGRLLPDGQRLTGLGTLLRRTSLDELPEFLNVLRGEMSLVGPRPLLFRYMPFFRSRERLRFTVRPGITGLAQISGRNSLGWDQRLELDAKYVEDISFRNDLAILWRTLQTVLLRQGVSADVDQVETWLDEERGIAGGAGMKAEVPAGPSEGT